MKKEEAIRNTDYTEKQLIDIALVVAMENAKELTDRYAMYGNHEKSKHYEDLMKAFRAIHLDMVDPEEIKTEDEKMRIRDELLRAKRKLEKNGAEVQYRAEMEEEGHYKIFVEIMDGGTGARSRSQMSCSTSGEAFSRA